MVNKIRLVLLLIAFATTLTAQNVGIGIAAPTGKLHIKGAADVSQLIIEANSTQSNTTPLFKLRNSLGNDLLWLHADDTSNIFLGLHAGSLNSISGGGAYNTLIGSNAGKSNISGAFNTATGAGALLSNTSGAFNTASGSVSLFSNFSGINNTASGSYSLSSNVTGSENTSSGYGSLFANTSGDNNTAIGVNALFSNVSGTSATAIGYNAMQYTNNTGDAFANYNVAVGYEALRGSTDPAANLGNDNTALGYQTLRSNTTGEANTASGSGALFYNTTGLANTATGTYSLNNNTTGNHNTALGYRALEANIAGDYNTATGSNALSYNSAGMWNTGIGSNALLFNVGGNANVALGNAALLSNTYGSSNTANGTDALFANIIGSSNTAIGHRTLYTNTTGMNNTAVGKEALLTILTGSNNTAIGYKANVAADDIVNATAIGSNAYAGATNSVVIGSINGVNGAIANANVGIGNATPHSSAALEVKSSDKGVLVPRIALTGANVASPVTAPADALLIYNTATAGSGTNAVEPGFYYWNASASRWNTMSRSPSNGSSGFGSWGDCSTTSVSEYNPVADEAGENGDGFGGSVSISGNYAIIGAPTDDEPSYNRGSASIYEFNGTNWELMQKITDATGEDGAWFGISVAISGNYAIVGAEYDGPLNEGSASIYQYNGSNWVLMQKLMDSNPLLMGFFGISVAISSSYAIVGAYRDDVGGGPTQGSASIFQYNGTNWVLMQEIIDATGVPGDWFGGSVSISGTYAIIGAGNDDVGANGEQGSASIYNYNGTSWVLMQKITDATGAASDFFGNSVSISGDYVIVGAHWDDVGSNTDQGSISIFKYNGVNWVLMQKIVDPNGAPSDYFGSSVSISGNLCIVGTHSDDVESVANQGSATIFQRVGTGWQKLQYLTDPGGSPQDFFGVSVAIDNTNKRFVVGSTGSLGGGKVVFGKLN